MFMFLFSKLHDNHSV